MSYVLLDDKFHSHAKTAEVGNAGAGLFARALSYCGDHLTDGFVPAGWAHEIGRKPLCRRLVDAGFWIAVAAGDGPFVYVAPGDAHEVVIEKPGYFILDYLESNPTRKSVLLRRSELSEKRAEAGRKGAAVRWQRERQNTGNGVATAQQNDGPLPLAPEVQEKSPRAVPVARPAQPPNETRNQVERSLREAS